MESVSFQETLSIDAFLWWDEESGMELIGAVCNGSGLLFPAMALSSMEELFVSLLSL